MLFDKLQATGNDFIVIDALEEERDCPRLARAMCDRHFGVGADGIILVAPSKSADLRMRMFNPDGSEAETCGNGLRCFTKYVIEKDFVKGPELTIETLAGVKKARATMDKGEVVRVQVTMGTPRLDPDVIPVIVSGEGARKPPRGPVIDYPVEIERRKLEMTFVSMGNPHAVAFISRPVAAFPLARVGPAVENHGMFPRRVNFEVVRILGRGRIEARVWERGAGETLACGSGACAIAVAARLHQYTEDTVDIMLPGGTLTITWDGKGDVLLSGPVAEVFTGEYDG